MCAKEYFVFPGREVGVWRRLYIFLQKSNSVYRNILLKNGIRTRFKLVQTKFPSIIFQQQSFLNYLLGILSKSKECTQLLGFIILSKSKEWVQLLGFTHAIVWCTKLWINIISGIYYLINYYCNCFDLQVLMNYFCNCFRNISISYILYLINYYCNCFDLQVLMHYFYNCFRNISISYILYVHVYLLKLILLWKLECTYFENVCEIVLKFINCLCQIS